MRWTRCTALLWRAPSLSERRPPTAARLVQCAAGKKSARRGRATGKPPQAPPGQKGKQQQAEEADDEENDDGVIYLDGSDDDELEEEGEDSDGEDGGGWLDDEDLDFGDEEDDAWGGGFGGNGEDDDGAVPPGSVSTGGAVWGAAAVEAVGQVLLAPEMGDLRLYALRCFASPRRLDVRLDKLSDLYGSPLLEDIEAFSRRLQAKLEEVLGADEAGEIALEVSSPGAERALVLPGDLPRFAALPLRVEFDASRSEVVGGEKKKKKKSDGGGDGGSGSDVAASAEQQQEQQPQQPGGGGASTSVAILELLSLDEAAGTSEWQLADVRANAAGKGRGLSRRQRDQRWRIPLEALHSARVHVDF